jgi:hypothetical protein
MSWLDLAPSTRSPGRVRLFKLSLPFIVKLTKWYRVYLDKVVHNLLELGAIDSESLLEILNTPQQVLGQFVHRLKELEKGETTHPQRADSTC